MQSYTQFLNARANKYHDLLKHVKMSVGELDKYLHWYCTVMNEKNVYQRISRSRRKDYSSHMYLEYKAARNR